MRFNAICWGAIEARLVWLCCLLFPFIFLSACKSEDQSRSHVQSVSPQWQKLGPGGGGSTYTPTFSYATPDHFLIRCDMTGSYLTTDGGDSYSQINFPNGTSSFAYDPQNANIIYMGSATLNKSSDGGKTWLQLFPKQEDILAETFRSDHADFSIQTRDSSLYNAKRGRIRNIRVDPVNASSLYFSMGRYLYFSADSGKTWRWNKLDETIDLIYTNANSLKNEALILTSNSVYTFNKSTAKVQRKKLPSEMAPALSFTAGAVKESNEVILYALHYDTSRPVQDEFGYSELWISRDLGERWERMEDGIIMNSAVGILPSYSMVSCAEFDAEHAYVVTNRYEEKRDTGNVYWYGALKTSDSGKSWNWVWKGGGGSGRYGVKDGVGVSNLKDAWVEEAFGGEYIRLLDVGIYPNDGNVAVVTDWYRTMKTIDGGKTWTEIYSKAQPDGTFTSRGLDVTTSYGVHFDPFDSSHIAISYTDIGYHHSFNGGKSWRRSVEGVPATWHNTCYWVVFDPDIKDKLWSAWSNLHDFPRGKMTLNPAWKKNGRGGICVSTDGGKTWKASNEGLGDDAPATSVVMDTNSKPGNRILYTSVFNKGVFKSMDDGKSWSLKNKGIQNGAGAFELTIQDDGTLFLTVVPTPADDGDNGRKFFPGALYKSTDGAETWTKLEVGNVLFPNGIDYDPENPDRIYLACWSDIMLRDLVRNTAADKDKILDTDGGIFLSEDGGKSWTSVFDKDQYVYDVTVDPHHKGRIYCNTFNKAAYRSDDYGKTWKKLKDYDFHWGHRVIADRNEPEKIFLTTFGSSVWHGYPVVE